VNRESATKLLAERLADEVVVTGLGQATLDMQKHADRDLNCYTFGSMGMCSSVAFGIALVRPDVKVISLDGDGSMLMNLGQLATMANEAPPNLSVIVWDNEVHQTTGGQPTATAFKTSLAAIAVGAGFEKVVEPQNEEELTAVFDRIVSGEPGPYFVDVKVDKGAAEGQIDRDPIWYKMRFMRALAALPVDRPGAFRPDAFRP
jgi:thiamine pyrophosphate-dependent acetolactate synthase large subunit-like protein